MKAPENRNMLMARVWVDELIRGDLAGVCIAPGSRSTPLAIAFAEQTKTPLFVHVDERSAAFFALGMALATGRPAVVLCTSGTAAANLFPAVVEASLAEIPLLALTADRPTALRHSGANQTMDQVKLFGDHVRWFLELPPAEREPAAASLRGLRTLAASVVSETLSPRPGPVHVNIPFDKPLEPSTRPGDATPEYAAEHAELLDGRAGGQPFTRIMRGRPRLDETETREVAELILNSRRGVIMCGPRCPEGDFPAAVTALAGRLGMPLLAEALSGVRFCPTAQPDRVVFGAYEVYLPDAVEFGIDEPDIVVQFGGAPVSGALLNWLTGMSSAIRVQVSAHGAWADEAHGLTHFLETDPAEFCRELEKRAGGTAPEPDAFAWLEVWRELESHAAAANAEAAGSTPFEGGWVARLAEGLDDKATVMVGSSLAVRHLDEFAGPRPTRWRVFSNRGASGIDGTLSTGLGIAAATGGPVLVLLGDLAMLHDLNALLAIRRFGLDAKVVVINNDGGGIFQRLPIAAYGAHFQELFKTPHGLNFEGAAKQFDLPYVRIENELAEGRRLDEALARPGAALIEIGGDAAHHEEMRRGIRSRFKQRMKLPISG
jgi:2-succinyl-5-enolpyruvyl-6-hydroxy-3-cyclohexene-1-carboxylate synthase